MSSFLFFLLYWKCHRHDPTEFALLPRHFPHELGNILCMGAEKVSIHLFFLCFFLVAIEAEKISELKRLAKIEFQNELAQQTASDLQGTTIGARRPLPPSEHKLNLNP
uniref:Uncharacterized protein n=1 Tax=Dromaius novaehollandiae TaxID=8790 RepID=A0A8C4K9E4_DRONO